MKLLVITQKVDEHDSNLGFFLVWLKTLATRFEDITVICLEAREYQLPDNVTVLSLGKEHRLSQWQYLRRLYTYIWQYRHDYDHVFVHMNPEYVILCGLLWRLWNKKILLWYTHKSVDIKLRIAEFLVTKIFTASKESFRLRSNKLQVMGHGIDVTLFAHQQSQPGDVQSLAASNTLFLLSVGRFSATKDFKTVIRAFDFLRKKKTMPPIVFNIFGIPLTKQDLDYQKEVIALSVELGVDVGTGNQYVSHNKMPEIYQKHHILIHTSQTGSVDKVVLEALAAGRIVVTSSQAYEDAVKEGLVFTFPEGNYQELAKTIEKIYENGILLPNQKAIDYVRKYHNLDVLIDKIVDYFK